MKVARKILPCSLAPSPEAFQRKVKNAELPYAATAIIILWDHVFYHHSTSTVLSHSCKNLIYCVIQLQIILFRQNQIFQTVYRHVPLLRSSYVKVAKFVISTKFLQGVEGCIHSLV